MNLDEFLAQLEDLDRNATPGGALGTLIKIIKLQDEAVKWYASLKYHPADLEPYKDDTILEDPNECGMNEFGSVARKTKTEIEKLLEGKKE